MNGWYFLAAIAGAALGAIPGTLAYVNQRRALKDARSHSSKRERRQQAETAVEGFSMLVKELRTELEREKRDCDRRIERIRHELLSRIVELEEQVEEDQSARP